VDFSFRLDPIKTERRISRIVFSLVNVDYDISIVAIYCLTFTSILAVKVMGCAMS
jgi:hypothetical protein